MSVTPFAEAVKQFHRQFVTGVTVVTVMDGGRPRGLAVNAFSSISLDPPTVMVCIQRTSSCYEALFATEHLAVNLLSSHQLDVVSVFASHAQDKFASVEWSPGLHGSPIIAGSAAHLEVEIRERVQASTHTIFFGRVVDAAAAPVSPMAYMGGKFYDAGMLTPLSR